MPVDDDGFSDTNSQYSRSSAGQSMSSWVSGSASQTARLRPARPRGHNHSSGDLGMGDLFSRLEAAERQLRGSNNDNASSRSSHSEERDNGLRGEQLLDEIERRSVKSEESHPSNGGHSGGKEPKAAPTKDSVKGTSSSGGTSGKKSSKEAMRRDSAMKRADIEKLDPADAKEVLSKMIDVKDEAVAKVETLQHKVLEEEAIAKKKGEENSVLKEAASEAEEAKAVLKVEVLADNKALVVTKEVLQDKLTNARAEKELIQEDRDALADALEGLKARHQAEIQRVKSKHHSEMIATLQQEIEDAKNSQNAEAIRLGESLRVAEREKERAVKEADILRVKEAMARAETTAKGAKVAAMRAELQADQADAYVSARVMESAAEAEQRLSEEMLELKKKMKALNNKMPGYETQMETLQQQWDSANQNVQQLRTGGGSGSSSSSSSSRPMERSMPSQPVAVAPPTLNINVRSQRAMGYTSLLARAPLATIAEGEDLMSGDGSIAGVGSMANCSVAGRSHHFSSNGDESVGDLHDFDDAVEDPIALIKAGKVDVELMVKEAVPTTKEAMKVKAAAEKVLKDKEQIAEELAIKKREKEHLKQEVIAKEIREHQMQEEIAEKVAADESKIARLQAQLASRWAMNEEKDEAIIELKQKVAVKDVRLETVRERLDDVWLKAESREENLKHIRHELEAKKGHQEDLSRWAQDLQDKLELAWEKSRLDEARCDDLRKALYNMEIRHSRVVEELHQEIHILKRGEGGQEGGKTETDGEDDTGDDVVETLKAELAESRKEVKKLEEERNILQNVLEWKEVQFRTTVEDLEQQLAALSKKLKQDVHQEQDNLLTRLDKQAETLRQSFQKEGTPVSGSTHEPTPQAIASAQGQSFPSVLAENRDGRGPDLKSVSNCSSQPAASDGSA